MHQPPEIAIIEQNTLTALGLRTILEELLPEAVLRVFDSFAAFVADTPDMYAHYFVSAQIFFEHTAFFRQRLTQTIVLAGSDSLPRLAGVKTLNICQDENGLARSILQLHRHGHQGGHPGSEVMSVENLGADMHDLSVREIEVLCLVARGFINKEIAERLHISLTTVISHRKNITEKLGIKSVSGLTIYAVMHGYVEADQI